MFKQIDFFVLQIFILLKINIIFITTNIYVCNNKYFTYYYKHLKQVYFAYILLFIMDKTRHHPTVRPSIHQYIFTKFVNFKNRDGLVFSSKSVFEKNFYF